MEIPSTEGPDCLTAVIDEAAQLDVRVHRVSQGSGVFMHTDTELRQMAAVASKANIEVSLFARPNAGWGLSALARTDGGALVAASAYGQETLVAAMDDVLRAAAFGFRSVLVSDLGVLDAFRRFRQAGALPADMQAKVSVMLPAANAGAARVLESLGASTLNVPTDLSLPQIAAIRACIDIPLDVYIESPGQLGGFMRFHEIPDLIRVASPVYLKFGLRNGPDIYPSGAHLSGTAIAMSRERVRRARLGLELLERSGYKAVQSELGATGLAVPEP
ncbi:MAG: U32 family peptidase [Candidatus Dormibacteraceae bacterium]